MYSRALGCLMFKYFLCTHSKNCSYIGMRTFVSAIRKRSDKLRIKKLAEHISGNEIDTNLLVRAIGSVRGADIKLFNRDWHTTHTRQVPNCSKF